MTDAWKVQRGEERGWLPGHVLLGRMSGHPGSLQVRKRSYGLRGWYAANQLRRVSNPAGYSPAMRDINVPPRRPGAPLAFSDELKRHVHARLSALPRQYLSRDGLRQAAVTVALTADRNGLAVLSMCRRGQVGSHRNQWGLPGGRVDQGETTEQAAVRELQEEIGLVPTAILGRLDDYVTRSGFHLTPYVMWCANQTPSVVSVAEIRSVRQVPFSELVRPDSPRWVDIDQSTRPVLQLPIEDLLIHAPTAAVMYQFSEVVLRNRTTRVADVEEPVFAWR